jgi:prenyltransferase beta subunit
MLQVARLAPALLGEAAGRVVEFLEGQLNEDGGTKDRAGNSDLYYTVFLLEGMIGLRAEPPVERVLPYLRRFDDGEGLDFVHLTCLARCLASMPADAAGEELRRRIAARIEAHRAADGGYASRADGPATGDREASGTVYNAFLALGAYQDLGLPIPRPEELIANVLAQRSGDGAFANGTGMAVGNTPATAAAATLLRYLDEPVPPEVSEWLLARCSPHGGFLVMPGAPLPDLLSTATALHALAGLQAPLEAIREPCLDFVDSLWTGKAFCGHWSDDVEDCEYTYYGLLAIGHLSL